MVLQFRLTATLGQGGRVWNDRKLDADGRRVEPRATLGLDGGRKLIRIDVAVDAAEGAGRQLSAVDEQLCDVDAWRQELVALCHHRCVLAEQTQRLVGFGVVGQPTYVCTC